MLDGADKCVDKAAVCAAERERGSQWKDSHE
jgi:hypothetical protein